MKIKVYRRSWIYLSTKINVWKKKKKISKLSKLKIMKKIKKVPISLNN